MRGSLSERASQCYLAQRATSHTEGVRVLEIAEVRSMANRGKELAPNASQHANAKQMKGDSPCSDNHRSSQIRQGPHIASCTKSIPRVKSSKTEKTRQRKNGKTGFRYLRGLRLSNVIGEDLAETVIERQIRNRGGISSALGVVRRLLEYHVVCSGITGGRELGNFDTLRSKRNLQCLHSRAS